MCQKVAPLAIKRTPPTGSTTPREPKYPLADLEEGYGLFIPADVQDKAKSKDKDKDDEEDEKPSPTPAYVFAAIFATLYIVGRILEDWLIKRLFRRKLAGS